MWPRVTVRNSFGRAMPGEAHEIPHGVFVGAARPAAKDRDRLNEGGADLVPAMMG